MARQREGDVSTFHFIDNLSRAIRHGGRILLDLIPKVYSTERMIRVLGEDMQPQNVQVAPTGQPPQPQANEAGEIIGHIYDITAGKYDLTVAAGPSYTSRRDEVMEIMTEWAQAGGPEVAASLHRALPSCSTFPTPTRSRKRSPPRPIRRHNRVSRPKSSSRCSRACR
jgi:hypothetical protein